jgi:adenylate kinase
VKAATRRIFIFTGPPGSGKGTLSNLCIEQLNWTHLSTGNLCRRHIAEQTVIGKQIHEAIVQGKYINDDLIVAMVKDWLLEQGDQIEHVILDGSPRTIPQAQALQEFVQKQLKDFSLTVVRLTISDEAVVARLTSRAVCKNKACQAVYSTIDRLLSPKDGMVCSKCNQPLERRNDDDPQTIRERLKTYYQHERPLLEYFEQVGIEIKKIAVEKPIHELFAELKMQLGVARI